MKVKLPFIRLLSMMLSGFFLLTVWPLMATNPPLSSNLVNLSQELLGEEYDDFVPEMVIEGNSIHTLWTNRSGNKGGYLFYCRSTDLGENWESPIMVYHYKDVNNRATAFNAQRLAVSGDRVYIGLADYDYGNQGTGYIYLLKSTNGGASFDDPIELDNSGGGYSALSNCYIKAADNQVALVYRDANYNNAFEGLYCLYSDNGGQSFVKTSITNENTSNISDFLLDGDQLIVVHEYIYYNYGLNTGRVFVSVSNDQGSSFLTHKVSLSYPGEKGEVRERCRSYHDSRYVPKLAKEGNTIHLIFDGYLDKDNWTVLYTRSTDTGISFEKAVDINRGKIGPNEIQGGQENLVAQKGQVYMEYLSTGSKVYLVHSEDNGATLSEPQDLMSANTHYIQNTWWPQLAIDPSDLSGKTVYFGAGAMMSRKSLNAGESFFNTTFLFPILDADVKESVLKIDQTGSIHWLSKGRIKHYPNYDYDIFYGHKKPQPEAGESNKALSIETLYNKKKELVIVPSAPSIAFDSVMTGEVWVKIRSEAKNTLNVLAKVNAYDGDTYQPSGYQLTFHKSGGKRYLNSGIETDKGQFINWTGAFIDDTLWHHLAFTYDASAGLNNFKTYFDGLMVLEETVTGSILAGDGLLMIGSRQSFNTDNNYLVDDVRLWNRALTQDEIIKNQTKTFTGQEDSLKLWLNFDDTFKDLSGNGNDAIPLYQGDLLASDFDPPLANFELFQANNEITFNNTTSNATGWLWDFGDESTSEQANPKYTYPAAGEYVIALKAKNENSVSAAVKNVSIKGLDRVEPEKAGNYGYATITVFGGGLTAENTQLILRKEGEEDILGEDVYASETGCLSAYFNLSHQSLGIWDMVVRKNAIEMVLPAAFTVEQGVEPEPWVSVTGRGAALFNMWQTYTINYGNNGNVDALGVPLNIAISSIPGLDVELVDFRIEANAWMADNAYAYLEDSIGDYMLWDNYFGNDGDARVYPIYIPIIPANSSNSIHIRIKSPQNYFIESWMNRPFFEMQQEETKSAYDDWPDESTKLNACIAASAMHAASGVASDLLGMVLPIGCAYNIFTYVWNPWEKIKPKHDQHQIFSNSVYAFSSTALSCLVECTPLAAIKVGVKAFQVAQGVYEGYQANEDCKRAFDPLSKNRKGVQAVSSFDPNEMIGPSGFGDENFMVKNNFIPYTILFENKPEATAPAHVVTLSDTLDLNVFKLSDFAFGAFGWGDTIITPAGQNLKAFSEDIDLRPDLNLIVRVSAKVDTLSGVVNWEFLSLNPVTMSLEEDPFVGFLPPNATSPEGEGFVSFSVGLKEDLVTNDEIRNYATIVFDANKPILTNEYVNTIDLTLPESQVLPIEVEATNNFEVSWSGSDEGSGIRDYSIYVLVNDTALIHWLLNTTATSGVFQGDIGSTYKFYSVATDNVSHIEAVPDEYDATTTIIVDVEGFELVKEELIVFPNPVSDDLKVSLLNAPCGVYVVDLVGINGALFHTQIYDDWELQQGITINVADYQPGQYIFRMVYGNRTISRKISIR